MNGLGSLYNVTLQNAFETFTVYYQIHLLALQLDLTMLMQKKKKKKVEKKDKVSLAILHCILRFVTYVTKPNCFGSSFFLGVCLIEYGM